MEIKRHKLDLIRWDTNNYGQRKESKSFFFKKNNKTDNTDYKKKVIKLYGRPGMGK